jgi:hypothetical protein
MGEMDKEKKKDDMLIDSITEYRTVCRVGKGED